MLNRNIIKKIFALVVEVALLLTFVFSLISCATKEKVQGNYVDTPVFRKTKYGKIDGEDMVWLVISEENDSYILMSEQLIDTLQFDKVDENREWQDTSLYDYLNTEFVNTCFSKDEIENLGFINDTNTDIVTIPTLENLEFLYGDLYYLANGFYNDKDYFEANVGIVAKPTKKAIDDGIEVFDNKVYSQIMQVDRDERYDFATDCSAYWVLDRNDDNGVCHYVTATGYISTTRPVTEYIGIRPIIRVKK